MVLLAGVVATLLQSDSLDCFSTQLAVSVPNSEVNFLFIFSTCEVVSVIRYLDAYAKSNLSYSASPYCFKFSKIKSVKRLFGT